MPDLSYIESCAQTLGEHLRPGATVVLESTTYPGTTEEVLVPILEKASGLKGGVDFLAGFSPERIAPGNARWSFEGTPKLVSGVDAKSLDVIKGFYDGIFQTTVPVSGPKVAEMAKLIENVFRFVNISMINELATLAAPLGVDVWEAIDAASTKPFGFTRFTPGPGVGGHCLPVDPLFLSWKIREELGVPFRFVELADDVNRHMPDYVVRRLAEALDKRGKSVSGSRILLLGLTYKFNATDLRNSPSARVAELLIDLGADVRGADPNIPDGGENKLNVPCIDASPEEIAAADAVVLLMDHPDSTSRRSRSTPPTSSTAETVSPDRTSRPSSSPKSSALLPLCHLQEFSCVLNGNTPTRTTPDPRNAGFPPRWPTARATGAIT